MDLIQKITIGALLALTGITSGMLIQHQIAVQRFQNAADTPKLDLKKVYEQRIARDKKLYADVAQLLKHKQLAKAADKLSEIQKVHPANSKSFIYQAKIQDAQGELAAAIHSYRMAIDIDPDYVDKKTPLFIGNEIMEMITEARGKLQREKKLKPGDTSITLALEDIYYLQRRIAGGCE